MEIRINSAGMTNKQVAYAALLARKHQHTRCRLHTYETALGNFQVRMCRTITVRKV